MRVVANVLDFDIVVNEFELQSRYYVHFRTNTLGKDINPLNPAPGYGLSSTIAILLQGWLRHYIIHNGWYAINKETKQNLSQSSFRAINHTI